VISASASTSNGWLADTPTRPRRRAPGPSRARPRPPPRRSARPAGRPATARRGSAGRCAPTGGSRRRQAAPRPAAAPPTVHAATGRRPRRCARRRAGRRRRPRRPDPPAPVPGPGRQEPLEPGSLAVQQRPRVRLIHAASSDPGSSVHLAGARRPPPTACCSRPKGVSGPARLSCSWTARRLSSGALPSGDQRFGVLGWDRPPARRHGALGRAAVWSDPRTRTYQSVRDGLVGVHRGAWSPATRRSVQGSRHTGCTPWRRGSWARPSNGSQATLGCDRFAPAARSERFLCMSSGSRWWEESPCRVGPALLGPSSLRYNLS
jgi:hypothetical protein